mmetsp:Transcript_1894/g.3774  ORF Transcript_1894/g.3774 Transcript_1894/m.3774 type:complete len:197 (-) Transcript_1894:34-624(-)|eukprot:1725335-Amphidinium_carterae.1
MARQACREAFSRYENWLQSHPTAANFVTAGILGTVSDAFCQKVVEGQKWDARRALSLTLFTSVYQGAICYHAYVRLYGWLIPETSRFGSTPFKSGLSKTLIDNFIHVPFFYTPSFYFTVGLLQGQSISEVWTTLRTEFVATVLPCWLLWIPLQWFNFTVVPVRFRTICMNAGCLVWNCYLSYQSKAASRKELGVVV